MRDSLRTENCGTGQGCFNLAEVSKSGPIAWDFTGFDIRLDSYDGHDVIVVGMMNHCHEVFCGISTGLPAMKSLAPPAIMT